MSQSTLELEDVVVRESVHAPENTAPKDPQKISTGRRLKPFLIFGLLPLVLVTGLLLCLHYRHFETTDDAQIDGHVNSISTRISGTVAWVNPKVVNNEYVDAGTLLFQLDPNDYQVALEQTQANLVTHEATASAAQVNVPITNASAFSQLRLASAARAEAEATQQSEEANLSVAEHKVQLDEAVYARAERDRVRYEALSQKHEIGRSEYDARETEAHSAQQTLEADRSAVISAQQKIAAARSHLAQKQAEVDSARTAPQQVTDAQARFKSTSGQVQQARADVHAAELNLSYTKIYAPVSGIIGRKTVELGQRVQQGQSLLAIVPVDDIWVTANFKETQLQLMRPGQSVTIHVDSFDHDYAGTVENLAGAAGTLFSLLPPENANGNFVKVVQRMPVRIRFNAGEDPQHLLRPGMSTESTVKVR
ncbi:MAG TPA: HlyD family secretion protein [Terriglobales bacterium]|jgi:membrane fusion protein (multidrug efflux system)|nr:HlyD family secretion protein [Terriglobales bacterium]